MRPWCPAGLIEQIKMAGVGRNVTVTVKPLRNKPGPKPNPYRIADAMLHDRGRIVTVSDSAGQSFTMSKCGMD
jgi:hypothetical protein